MDPMDQPSHTTLKDSKKPLREEFLQAFSSIPIAVRKEIVATIEEGPVTWEVAYLEIKNNTEKGKEILKKMEETGLL